jgi:predicted DNA-binding transcriptional regulator AlpA
MNVSDRFLTASETCAALNISRNTYQRLKGSGQFPIPPAKQTLVAHALYRQSDVDTYIRTGRVKEQ